MGRQLKQDGRTWAGRQVRQEANEKPSCAAACLAAACLPPNLGQSERFRYTRSSIMCCMHSPAYTHPCTDRLKQTRALSAHVHIIRGMNANTPIQIPHVQTYILLGTQSQTRRRARNHTSTQAPRILTSRRNPFIKRPRCSACSVDILSGSKNLQQTNFSPGIGYLLVE